MTLTSLTSTDLKHIGKLLVQKEVLLARIGKIDHRLAAYEGGTSVAPAPTAAAPARRGKRRSLKRAIIGLLQNAGQGGLAVKEIAARVKLDPNRIYTWFYGTGKKVKQIKKIGGAQYRWEA